MTPLDCSNLTDTPFSYSPGLFLNHFRSGSLHGDFFACFTGGFPIPTSFPNPAFFFPFCPRMTLAKGFLSPFFQPLPSHIGSTVSNPSKWLAPGRLLVHKISICFHYTLPFSYGRKPPSSYPEVAKVSPKFRRESEASFLPSATRRCLLTPPSLSSLFKE